MTSSASQVTDRTDTASRIVAAIVVPILVLAFIILFFLPDQSGQRFAWAIAPHMTAAFMAAGYLGGAYVFVRVAMGDPWHHVKHGFPPVTAFTTMMLIVTVLHWERFELSHFPFQLWLLLYVVTPFLIPYLWWRNRHQDPGSLAEGDVTVPVLARWAMLLAGAGFALFSLIGLFAPTLLIEWWVWPLSALTARIMAGWFALLAVGGLTIGRETRWSGWRVGLISIGLWHALILVAAGINSADFLRGPINWYTILVFLSVVGMVGLFVAMERKRSQRLFAS
jgi:hypothetical protein